MPGHMWSEWWMLLFGALLMLLFWGGVIALAYWAVRALLRQGRARREPQWQDRQREKPLDILQQRYARGELTREEYQSMRRDLEE
jgi:putative membrane protein